MVVDFAVIKSVWEQYLKPHLDHRDLNDSLRSVLTTTTAEYIAAWICRVFHDHAIPVTAVELWETETSCARVDWTEEWANGH